MRRRLIPTLLAFTLGVPAFAQQPFGTPSFNEQQIVAIFTGIAQHAARIEPMLSQLRPDDWVTKGAPDTYVIQLSRSLEEMHGIQTDMAALAQHPDRMIDAMKALFRAQASHQILGSLMGGLRKYQNPALADLIEAVAAEDQGDITRLQQFLLELAGEKDQQFKLVDSEAQRCRGSISRQACAPATPAPSPARAAPVRKTP